MSVENNTFDEENETPLDYIHFNSMEIDQNDNNLIYSFRNTDSIVKLDRETWEIIWILGGKYDEFNLDDERLFSRKHHARLSKDGYLTIYDNGVAKFYKYTGSVQ